MSENLKFYPRPVPILVLMAVSLALLWSGLWLSDHDVTLVQRWDMPIVERVLRGVGRALAGVGFFGSMVMSIPLIQLIIWRRASVTIEEDDLAIVLGLVRVQRLSWKDVAEVRARRLSHFLGLGWVTVRLMPRGGKRGRSLTIPSFFLDHDVEEVAGAIEPRIQPRTEEQRQPQPQQVQQHRRRRRRQPGARK